MTEVLLMTLIPIAEIEAFETAFYLTLMLACLVWMFYRAVHREADPDERRWSLSLWVYYQAPIDPALDLALRQDAEGGRWFGSGVGFCEGLRDHSFQYEDTATLVIDARRLMARRGQRIERMTIHLGGNCWSFERGPHNRAIAQVADLFG